MLAGTKVTSNWLANSTVLISIICYFRIFPKLQIFIYTAVEIGTCPAVLTMLFNVKGIIYRTSRI